MANNIESLITNPIENTSTISSNQPSESTPSTLSHGHHLRKTRSKSNFSYSSPRSGSNKDNMNINIQRQSVHKWNISGSTFEQFKRAKHEKGFESDEFVITNHNHKIIKQVVWKLECYPNGYFDDDLNKCKLMLVSVALPENISKIVTCFTLFCHETQTRYVGTDQFTYNSCQCGWNDDTMTFDRVQQLSFVYFLFLMDFDEEIFFFVFICLTMYVVYV